MVANNELLLYLSGIEWGLEFSKGLLGLTWNCFYISND